MKQFSVYEAIERLIGAVNPVGETNTDDTRFENLKELIMLTDALLSDIDRIASNKNSHMFSVKRAGKLADEFLTRIGIDD